MLLAQEGMIRMDNHFVLRRSEFVVEQLRAFERALNKHCEKKKLSKRARRGLNYAHLIILELLSSEQNEFCRYTMREYARKVFECKPKGFNRAWRYVLEQVQSYMDSDKMGAEP